MPSVPEAGQQGHSLADFVTETTDSVTARPGEEAIEISHENNVAALFVQVGIGLGRDPRLRRFPAAVTVYLNIRGHSPAFPLYLSTIQRQTGWGREAVSKALGALETFGYLRRDRLREDGGRYGRWRFHTNDAPPGSPQAGLMVTLAARLLNQLGGANALPVDNPQQLDLLQRLAAAGWLTGLTSNFAPGQPSTGNPSLALTSNFSPPPPPTGNPSMDPTSKNPQSAAGNCTSEPATGKPATVNPSDIEEVGGVEHQKEEHHPAPPARGAGNARRATNASEESGTGGASAATDGPKAAGKTASEISGTVPPDKRRAGKKDLRRADRGGLLPVPLALALSAQTPNLPNVLADFYAVALQANGRDRMASRIERRWFKWTSGGRTFAEHEAYGTLGSPLGVLYELIGDPECELIDCEDGFYTHNGEPCEYCVGRMNQRRGRRKASGPAPQPPASIPAPRPPSPPVFPDASSAPQPPLWYDGGSDATQNPDEPPLDDPERSAARAALNDFLRSR